MPFLADLLVAVVTGSLAFLAARWYSGSEAVPQRPAQEVARAVGEAVRPRSGLRRLVVGRLDRSVATGLLLTLALGATLVGGIVLGVLAVLVRRVASIQHVDTSVADWGFRHRSSGSTSALRVVTDLGNIRLVLLFALVLVAVELVRRRSRWSFLFLLAVLAGEEAAMLAVKGLVGRVRPALTSEAATLGPSFPSGHSATAAAFYAAAALVLGRTMPGRARHIVIAVAVALAAAVGASRVLLDLHWLSDVIGGLALGWAWFALCAIAFGGRLLIPTAAADIAAAEAATPKHASVRTAVRNR
jgi:membrane-associated phospholipid phosphatase